MNQEKKRDQGKKGRKGGVTRLGGERGGNKNEEPTRPKRPYEDTVRGEGECGGWKGGSKKWWFNDAIPSGRQKKKARGEGIKKDQSVHDLS